MQTKHPSAISAILYQIMTGVISLVIGGILISLVTFIANIIPAYNQERGYTIVLSASFGFIILIVYTIKKQFENSISQTEITKTSTRYAFYIWIVSAILSLSLPISILLISEDLNYFGVYLAFAIIDSILLFVLYRIFGNVFASIQIKMLNKQDFHKELHLKWLGNSYSVLACENGILPFRIKVQAFWIMAILGAMSLLIFLGCILIVSQGDFSVVLCLVMIMFLVSTYKSIQYFNFLRAPSLRFTEQKVTDKAAYSGRGLTIHHIICDQQKFTTDTTIWNDLHPQNKYKLWFSLANRQIVAFEYLDPIDYAPSELALKGYD